MSKFPEKKVASEPPSTEEAFEAAAAPDAPDRPDIPAAAAMPTAAHTPNAAVPQDAAATSSAPSIETVGEAGTSQSAQTTPGAPSSPDAKGASAAPAKPSAPGAPDASAATEPPSAEAAAAGEAFERKLDARLVMSVAAAGIMSFSGTVIETAMNITFPTLMEEFGVSTATVQWITTGYMLALSIIVPLSAFLKRRFKMRSMFVTAALLFLAGTVMCATAPAFGLIIAGRVVQAIGTGIALPLMFNIIIEQTPYEYMGTMMGVGTLVSLVAPAVGPSLGGLIATYLGWRMIFVVLMPLIVVALIMGAATIRQSTPTGKASFSVPQFLVLGAAFACLVFATTSASTAGWLSAKVLVLLAGFALLIAVFYVMASRSENPLIHVQAFKCAPYSLSILYIPLLSFIILGLSYIIPNYAQLVCGMSEFAAGCLLLPGCIVCAVLSPLAGRILDNFGAKKPIIAGALCVFVSIALFAIFGPEVGTTWLAAIYVLTAVGQGLSSSNTITNGLSYLPEELKADGNACFNTLQPLGGAVGTAVVTSIVNAQQEGAADLALATTVGMQQAFYVLLAVAAAALLCSLGTFASAKHAKKDVRKA